MEALPWVLLLLGAIVIGVIYLLTRREQRLGDVSGDPVDADQELGLAPRPGGMGRTAAEATAARWEDEDTADAGDSSEKPGETIVVIHLRARREEGIHGPELVKAAKQVGLRFGEMNIFHYRVHGEALFSLANMVKPGWFDMEQIEDFYTPGVTLMMPLPGPRKGSTALNTLLMCVHQLSQSLDAEPLDEDHNPLNYEKLHALQEDVEAF